MPIVKVPVVKGKGTVNIDTDALNEEYFRHVVEAGLKALVNGGMSKVTKAQYPVDSELQEAAMKVAQERAEKLVEGTLKIAGKKAAGKASGAVMSEARRLARAHVKDLMREQGIKVSHVDAKDITAAANTLLESMPELIEEAKANIAKRSETPVAGKIDLASIIKINPAKKAKADKEAADKKAKGVSAKQAGMPAKRKPKPGAQANA